MSLSVPLGFVPSEAQLSAHPHSTTTPWNHLLSKTLLSKTLPVHPRYTSYRHPGGGGGSRLGLAIVCISSYPCGTSQLLDSGAVSPLTPLPHVSGGCHCNLILQFPTPQDFPSNVAIWGQAPSFWRVIPLWGPLRLVSPLENPTSPIPGLASLT